ncbi:MAG: ATP-binding protein [Gallionella sp.]|nr:ATP-binding protein [Gallionella sp.]
MSEFVSFRRRVLTLMIVPVLLMVVTLEGVFLSNRFSDLDQSLLERGKMVASQLAAASEYGVFSNNQGFLQAVSEGALRQKDVHGAVVLNAASEALVKVGDTANSLAYMEVNLLNPVRSGKRSIWIYQPIIPVQVALDDFGEKPLVQQLGAVVIEMDRERTDDLKSRLLWLTALITVGFMALVLYLLYLAGRSITRPISELSEAVQAIGRGELDTRVELHSGVEELVILERGLNRAATLLRQDRAVLQQKVEDATRALREKKEEAERASQDKSRFLATASHDLRQPMHALGLYVSELQRKVTTPEQRQLAGQLEQSVESLSTLLNALLDISKLDAGVVVPQVQQCDVAAVLRRVETDYQMLASIKNLNLVVRPCRAFVSSDPMLLGRILMNLVSNAVRYTPPNGCVLVVCRKRGAFLRIEVRDNGAGIAELEQQNVFREFFRLMPAPSNNEGKGLGLGLAIVDRLARLLDHRIELRSVPGKGSVFAVEVPLLATPPEKPLLAMTGGVEEFTQDETDGWLADKRVLMVDDDILVLSSTSSILASWGCVVSEACSIGDVEQLLREGAEWDIVISDYQLEPEASGIDVVALVRQHHRWQVPCILISGDTSPAILKLASVGGHHLLHKPVKPAKLRSLVAYLLQRAKPE